MGADEETDSLRLTEKLLLVSCGALGTELQSVDQNTVLKSAVRSKQKT